MKFTHLHVHSHYSLLDGLAKIDELLARVKELEMDSLALTDHGVMYGAVEFFIKAKEKGIKPILGCEMYLAPNDLRSKNPNTEDRIRYHLILLIKNEKGYKNLMKLVSIAHLEGFYYKPRIDKKTLRENCEGLIGMSACIEGEIPSLIVSGKYDKAKETALELEEIFGKGNFFMEVQHHPHYLKQNIANDGIIRISKETGIPVVATGDVHYVDKNDSSVQDILLCIQTNRKVQENNRMNLTSFDLSMKSPDEMIQAFAHFPEAVSNTQKVVEQINFDLHMGETILPHYQVPSGFTPESYLRWLAEKGLARKYGSQPPQGHLNRMNYELSIISKTGLASYFLIVQDFVNWARDQGIVVGPGRGSAAGSFVSYLIGITSIDPIKYNLLFERFLNPERVSMPDIDMDFADDRRDEVLDYVRKKYGEDHVAQIITFGTMGARAALRDAGRALGYPYQYCDKTAKMVPMFFSIEKSLEEIADFKNLYASDPAARKLIDSAKRLEGVARHASMHACGVVITDKPVMEYSPLQKIAGKKESIVTQYSSSTKSSCVEKIGLLKMDFLGLKNLTIIQNTLRIVRKTKNLNLNIDEIPLDDEKVYELLRQARTTGVFQLESTGMKRYLKQLGPTEFEDIIAMVALYRPGPMEWIPDFIAGKHGTKRISYLHPKLEPILKNTYGVAVYQEQLMQIARDLAGFTLGEADVLRKAVGKKIPQLIREQRAKFVSGCVKNGISKKIAEKVFDFIEPFAGYGFNRSHAACYALIGYQTAYLKAHFPSEFMTALLTSDQDDIDRIAVEVAEAREMGIEVLPPDVNESLEEFAVVADENNLKRIRFGLNAIKNVGKTVAHEIVEERKRGGKYESIVDFIERVQHKDLNKKSLEALSKVGALDKMGERNQLLLSVENMLNFSRSLQKTKNSNQFCLFDKKTFSPISFSLVAVEPATKKQKLQWEKELLGLYVSDHPLSEYREYLESVTVPIHSLEKKLVDKKIKIGGIISKIHKVLVRNQNTMLFVTIEDMQGKIEVLVFPKTLEHTKDLWIEDNIVIVKGRLSDKEESYKMIVDEAHVVTQEEVYNFKKILAAQKMNHKDVYFKHEDKNCDNVADSEVAELSPFTRSNSQKLIITLAANSTSEIIKRLSVFFDGCEAGDMRVYLVSGDTKLETPYSIKNQSAIFDKIRKLVPQCQIKIV